ncbi:MAG: response regulator [Nitrospirae bacterium]|uniref:Response regulator receiver n=1 Tax=uncultured Nitrospirota bacterium TaxID=170969 RepID=A0A142BTT6_9BACT|nr:response regulator receiver [uncultured Nitrospirota bacterium]MBF0328619.1 response regulator [Nitrospirota bacterium]
MEKNSDAFSGVISTGINILVVEDEIITARDIESKLKKIGYNVCDIASSGKEAIQKAEDLMPDMILMDITLEGDMDGIEAATQIEKRLHIPFVYLTAHSDLDTLHRAKITEPYGYIVKPFTQRDLIITIGMALYKHKMEMKMKAITEMLRVFLRPLTLEEKLTQALQLIVSIPRLFIQTKGAIYLMDERSDQLVSKASLSSASCPTVPVGTCLCGEAASTRAIVFSGKMDKKHVLQPNGHPHGHYCVPIMAGDRLLGVINVYVKDGHKRDAADENILLSFADVIANALGGSSKA